MQNIQIRKFAPEDGPSSARLFYDTVHTINRKDYTEEQLDAWAPKERDLEAWTDSFQSHTAFVAEMEGRIVGFGDMDETGYLDRLYVHRDFQGKGITSALCDALEQAVPAKGFLTHASLTAYSFFQRRGYRVLKEQRVIRHGVSLTNFVMEKKNCPETMASGQVSFS